ncbi:type II toxin-antitoxin system HipA family toxin [Aquirufa sp. ROCK-SH2]
MISSIEKLLVSIDFGSKFLDLGELILDRKKVYFKYLDQFLDEKLNISPFKLQLNNSIQSCETTIFDGLHGVFGDSLPDGWGRLLVDRKLQKSRVNPYDVNPLNRLAIVGKNGPGALIYQPIIENEIVLNPNQISGLDEISDEIQYLLKDESTRILDQLFILGGSSGGARPKVNLFYNPKSDKFSFSDSGISQTNFEHWIVKFPSSFDPKDIANIEYAYYLMAIDAGLKMNDSKLFQTPAGNYYFGTKRFDRNKNERHHLHSAAGILHDNFRLSNIDYGHLMDCAFKLESNVSAYENILKLAAFNVFSHNRDDHSKNVSFLMNAEGNWTLAPTYDLTFSTSSHGYHSTSIAGEAQNPEKSHLLKLAQTFGIKHANHLLDQVQSSIQKWNQFADEAKVSKMSKQRIAKIIVK